VEIVKVLYRGADILILDEPTAVLTPQETDKLFAVLRNMRNDGKAIVIITHKMHEVEALSDRVAILRHGQFVGDMLTSDTDAQEMTNMMVGHAVTLNIDRPDPVDPKPPDRGGGADGAQPSVGVLKMEGRVPLTANKTVRFWAHRGHLRLRGQKGDAGVHRRSAARWRAAPFWL
jgi:simple sugar transport system ATP-binding protein